MDWFQKSRGTTEIWKTVYVVPQSAYRWSIRYSSIQVIFPENCSIYVSSGLKVVRTGAEPVFQVDDETNRRRFVNNLINFMQIIGSLLNEKID